MTAANVTSLPVPAVVGTAMISGVFASTLSTPRIFDRLCFGLAMRAATPLRAVHGRPAAKPMMAWHPASRYIWRAASTLDTVGFATV